MYALANALPAPAVIDFAQPSESFWVPGNLNHFRWQIDPIATPVQVASNDALGLNDWSDNVRAQFAKLRNLRAGWDGYGAAAISRHTLSIAAHDLHTALAGVQEIDPPEIVPVADGGLQIEWHVSRGRFEMYFYPDGERSAWLHDMKAGVELEGQDVAALQLLRRWIDTIGTASPVAHL